jgi:1-acyl-sn-glycerol-3-phosphate acyltransferase
MAWFTSTLRYLAGLALLAVLVPIFAVLCVLLLPWRATRIRLCNIFGHIVGRSVVAITGARLDATPFAGLGADGPAIYVSNHTSALDIFLGIWIAPMGTCGVAKKEVVYYPLFGQLYAISGHLRLDRKNRESAIEALRGTAEEVRRHRLGIWMWPEGTRARDGRLQPFKKGFVHMAIATGLPIVPVLVTGAHRVWRKNDYRIHGGEVAVRVLPAIPTTGWRAETTDEHVAQVWRAMNEALPAEHRALREEAAAAK